MMQLGTLDFLRDGTVKESLKILLIGLNNMGKYIQFCYKRTSWNTEIFFIGTRTGFVC